MTHIVCVLGKYQGQDVITKDYEVAQNNRWLNIQYLDWPVNSESKRRFWREVFGMLADALSISANTVLVHCKNGKDRSAFTVYAFLRLLHSFPHKDAISLVNQRLDIYGQPLFDYNAQDSKLTCWLQDSLESSVEPESGQLRWHRGVLVDPVQKPLSYAVEVTPERWSHPVTVISVEGRQARIVYTIHGVQCFFFKQRRED